LERATDRAEQVMDIMNGRTLCRLALMLAAVMGIRHDQDLPLSPCLRSTTRGVRRVAKDLEQHGRR